MQVLAIPAFFGHSDCERIAGTVLAQPVLAITSLAYVAAGVAVLWWAVRAKAPLAAVAAVVLMAIGTGSFAFHGPQPAWAQAAHDWPIIAAGVVYAAGLASSVRRRDYALWLTAAVIFTVGLGAYVAGRSGSPLCRPDSLWQYHGVWHMLSGVAAGWAALAMAPGRRVSAAHWRQRLGGAARIRHGLIHRH